MNEVISVYLKRTTQELRQLKSAKYNRLQRLRSKRMGYKEQQEIKLLEFQLSRIDTVLRSRAEQGLLFP